MREKFGLVKRHQYLEREVNWHNGMKKYIITMKAVYASGYQSHEVFELSDNNIKQIRALRFWPLDEVRR